MESILRSGDPELSDLRSKFWISNPTGGGTMWAIHGREPRFEGKS